MANTDQLKREILRDVKNGFGQIDKSILDEVFKFIDTLDTSGGRFNINTLSVEKLDELRRAILRELTASPYKTKVNDFVRSLGKITINTVGALDANGYDFQRAPLNNIERKWQAQSLQSLEGSGLNEGFVRPVLQIVDSSISYGKSVTELRKELNDYIIGGKDQTGKLQSYVTTTAREAVSTMQGVQINGIANEMGYDYIQYSGGLLDDSRGQCFRWVEELNGKIPKDKLAEEIRLAYRNQRNKVVIIDGENKHRYSGMKPDTTVLNFIIVRGGWGCLHTAFPRNERKKKRQ